MDTMATADIAEAMASDLGGEVDFDSLVDQIVDGLTYRAPKNTQAETLRIWQAADDWVHVENVQKQLVEKQIVKLSEAAGSVRGVLSGFGIRMAQKATGAPSLNRAISVLVHVKWDERGSSSHVLTPAGRKAVEIVLGRLDGK
jgi:hypothetical protein